MVTKINSKSFYIQYLVQHFSFLIFNKSVLSLAPRTYGANEMADSRAKCLCMVFHEPETTEENGSPNAVRT